MNYAKTDYSDGRIFSGKPIAAHLRPDYWPQRQRERIIPVVKIRRGGRIIAAISLGDDGDLLALLQNS